MMSKPVSKSPFRWSLSSAAVFPVDRARLRSSDEEGTDDCKIVAGSVRQRRKGFVRGTSGRGLPSSALCPGPGPRPPALEPRRHRGRRGTLRGLRVLSLARPPSPPGSSGPSPAPSGAPWAFPYPRRRPQPRPLPPPAQPAPSQAPAGAPRPVPAPSAASSPVPCPLRRPLGRPLPPPAPRWPSLAPTGAPSPVPRPRRRPLRPPRPRHGPPSRPSARCPSRPARRGAGVVRVPAGSGPAILIRRFPVPRADPTPWTPVPAGVSLTRRRRRPPSRSAMAAKAPASFTRNRP